MKNLILIFLCIFFATCGTTAAAETRTIAVDFAYTPPTDKAAQLLGYKLYKNGVQICAGSDPYASSMICSFSTEAGTFDFALRAYFTDNTESPASPGFSFTITPSAESVPPQLQAVIDATLHSGKVPLAVSFSGSSSTGDITSYSWEFGDGATGSGPEPGHSYVTPGTYTVTLQVTNRDGATHQTTTTITALPGNSTLLPPVAVISSSSGVGNAPLLVTFDAAGSTSPNPPITGYSWSFGDSTGASGARTSHSFTTPGVYQVELTIQDSRGLTDTAHIPVIVSDPGQPNETPDVFLSTNRRGGIAPVSISFDGSRSSDPDGSISLYIWDFGDGISASGSTARHTYSTPGIYTASLTVVDNRGGTATATSEIVCSSSSLAGDLNMEAGEVTIDHTWSRVLFDGTFNQPVVIAGSLTINGKAPALVRVRNIDQTGFEIRVQEWAYLDGRHATETVSYLVMEEGAYTLDNGSRIEAGYFTGTKQFQEVTLQNTYAQTPVILTQVATVSDADPVTGRLHNTGRNSFEYRLQEQETKMLSHKPETVGYIAWEPGQGSISGLAFEAGNAIESASHKWFELQFLTGFSELPYLFPGIQTMNGRDTATLRHRDMSPEAVQLKIQEEKSSDSETKHKNETLGYLIIGAANQ